MRSTRRVQRVTELLIAVAGGLLVGASLGMVGAGGAILSVPIFEILLGHPPKDAVAEALLVTFAVAAVSAARAARVGLVDWRRALLLGVPGFVGAAAGGWLAHDLSDRVQMGLFSVVALVAAWRMASMPTEGRPKPGAPNADTGVQGERAVNAARAVRTEPPRRRALLEALLVGFGIGVLTGLIGVGGGFLLVPALVVLLRVPMRVAVGTSLAVIVLNSAVAFIGNRVGDPRAVHPDWIAVAVVAGFGIAGSLVGNALGGRLPAHTLRRVFAALLVLVAAVVIGRQVLGSPQRAEPSPVPAAAT